MADNVLALLSLASRVDRALAEQEASAAVAAAQEDQGEVRGSLPAATAQALAPAKPELFMAAYRKVRAAEGGLPKLTQSELVVMASAMARLVKALPPAAMAKIVARVEGAFPKAAEQ